MSLCHVYWGSHGCDLDRGHKVQHFCGCCECADHEANSEESPGVWCVGAWPYYGPETRFYGEDAEALGLPLVGSL